MKLDVVIKEFNLILFLSDIIETRETSSVLLIASQNFNAGLHLDDQD